MRATQVPLVLWPRNFAAPETLQSARDTAKRPEPWQVGVALLEGERSDGLQAKWGF